MRLNRGRRGFTSVLKLDSFAISSANGHTSNTIPVKAATWILKQTPRSCSISKPTANSLTSISPRPFPSRFPGCANWWSSFRPRATSFAAKPHALSRDGKSKAQAAACPATCRRRPVAANPPQRASPVTRPWSNNPPGFSLDQPGAAGERGRRAKAASGMGVKRRKRSLVCPLGWRTSTRAPTPFVARLHPASLVTAAGGDGVLPWPGVEH